MKVVTAAEMRHIEAQAMAGGDTVEALMDRAGRGLAAHVRNVLGGAEGRCVLVLAGPGNNGGDGLVAARYLAAWGAEPYVALALPRPDDPLIAALDDYGVPCGVLQDTELSALLSRSAAVIDALLGTGHSRPLTGQFLRLATAVAAEQQARPSLAVVAADLPSGMDADTGAADPAALACTSTVTFGLPKHGHFRFPGAALCGRLVTVDIGLPAHLSHGMATELLTPAAVVKLLPARPAISNKGAFGRMLSIGGCINYMGAPVLACRGALRAGAGLVTMAAPRTVTLTMAPSTLEITHLPLPETDGGFSPAAAIELLPYLERYDAAVVGCGMGRGSGTLGFLEALLLDGGEPGGGLVIDADALNLLAGIPDWWDTLLGGAVLTPHPGEMARLLHSTVSAVQDARIATASAAATRWEQVVVLKGAYTVIAAPDGRVRLSPFANPALATAGTGDVLAGVIGALLAQGLAPFDAASAGVFLHGLAGAAFVRQRGESGLLASDLAEYLPGIMQQLRSGRTTGWDGAVDYLGDDQ